MSNVRCPRCGDSFRLPAVDIPPGASARCPWCSETLPVAQLLSSLPPVAELISADGAELANPFATAPDSDVDWDDSADIAGDSAAELDFDDPVEVASDQPFAPLDDLTDRTADEDAQPDDLAAALPLEFGAPAEPRPLSEVADLAFDQDDQRLNTRARAKKKPATLRSILGVVIGGLMAFPLAAVILALLGKPLDLGFWPFDGNTIATGTSSRTAAPLPVTAESPAEPQRPAPPQDRSLAYDLQRSTNGNGVIQADHNRVESPTAATTPDASDTDDALPLESESAPWTPVPLQVPGNRTAGGPEWVEPLAADDDEPLAADDDAEQPLPPELQQPAPEPTQPETATLDLEMPALETSELAMTEPELAELGLPALETPELQLPTGDDLLALPQPDEPPSIDAALAADEEAAATAPEDAAATADAAAPADAERLPEEDEAALAELALPATAEPASDAPATASPFSADEAPVDESPVDESLADPAPLTSPDLSEPLLAQPSASSVAVQAAVEQADASRIAVQNYDQAAGPSELKRHLATLYQDIAAVAEKAQRQDEAVIARLIARVNADELIKVLAPAAPNWLKYSKRPNDGMLAVGVLRQAQDKWFVDWSGAVPLEIRPGDASLPAAGSQVLVLGRIVHADPTTPAVELVYIEPL